MATSKRTTAKSHRRSTRNRQAEHKVAELLYSFTNALKPSPLADPTMEIFTRSQRLRLADLHAATGVSTKRAVRRAMENFLQTEAMVWHRRATMIN